MGMRPFTRQVRIVTSKTDTHQPTQRSGNRKLFICDVCNFVTHLLPIAQLDQFFHVVPIEFFHVVSDTTSRKDPIDHSHTYCGPLSEADAAQVTSPYTGSSMHVPPATQLKGEILDVVHELHRKWSVELILDAVWISSSLAHDPRDVAPMRTHALASHRAA